MPATHVTDARESSFSGILARHAPLQDTAYPRLKNVLMARDLAAAFKQQPTSWYLPV